MKVVLTTLPSEGQYVCWIHPLSVEPKAVKYMPLGLLSLASNIAGHEIKILDPYSEQWGIEETIERIHAEKPDVVGFSAETRRLYALYELLKRVECKWKICGGPHATYHAEQLLSKGADAVFKGPLADMELQKWLDKPVNGVILCDSPLKEIHFPKRELIDYKSYFFSGKVLFKAQKRMVMFTSIGCPHGCKFCSVQSKKIQRKTPEMVVDEMSYLKDVCGAESIHLLDDNFNLNSKNVSDIMAEMEKRSWKTEWSMRGQVKFDLSLVPRLKSLGLKRFHVGIEALDSAILKWLGKRHDLQDVEDMCNAMNENGIDILAYFMFGIPGETDEYLNSIQYKIRDYGIKHPYTNILFPEPDTAYGDSVAKKYWDEYMENPTPGFALPLEPPKKAMDFAEKMIRDYL